MAHSEESEAPVHLNRGRAKDSGKAFDRRESFVLGGRCEKREKETRETESAWELRAYVALSYALHEESIFASGR